MEQKISKCNLVVLEVVLLIGIKIQKNNGRKKYGIFDYKQKIIKVFIIVILMQKVTKLKKTVTHKMLYIGGAIWQGQDIKGVEETPDIIRNANLLEVLRVKYQVEGIDLGDISAKNYKQGAKHEEKDATKMRNLPLLDNLLEQLNNKILQGLNQHQQGVVVTVGGDHSVGTSTLHALNTYHKDLKVIWVDAHPDFIDPTMSEYPNYHGYPVSHVTGLAKFPGFNWLTNLIPYENLVLIAIRDIDADQWINLKKLNIKCFTMDRVTQLGIGQVMKQAFQYLDPVGDKPFHISFDIDAIDPHIAFGTGTKFRGGLTPTEANYIVRSTAHERNLVGLDVVEINKKLENQEVRLAFRGQHAYGLVSPTVGLGIDLIDSVFTRYFTL